MSQVVQPVRLGDGDHVVKMYESDDDLTRVVVGYLAAAIRADETVIVIATPGHRAAFAAALGADGLAVDVLEASGRFIALDAQAVLDQFMVDGAPDTDRFEGSVGELVADAAAQGRPVRAFGEMVDVLWAAGDVAGAIAIERLWTDLAERVAFALLCAYAGADEIDSTLGGVCRLHTDTVTTAPPFVAEVTRGFPRSRISPAFARQFVTEVLTSWGRTDLVPTAKIAVSELAANAVLHAESEMTIGLDRTDDGIRLTVTDSSPTPPAPRQVLAAAPGGRGMHLVHSAGPWTWVPSADGKAVTVTIDRPL